MIAYFVWAAIGALFYGVARGIADGARLSGGKLLANWLVATVLYGCLIFYFSPWAPMTPEEKSEELKENCANDVGAFVAAQYAVKPLLKAPSEADFPSILHASMDRVEECKWSMVSYVDAQNSFGATVRVAWTAVAEFDESSDAWQVLDARIIE